MARKRMLHPEYFASRTLSDLPVQTMVTFAGLWVYCDDYGRGEDDPTMVKATVWPRRKAVTVAKVEVDLDLLAEAGPLCRYVVGGFPLLHVPSWGEHQKVSHPTPSKLPPCPTCDPALWDWFVKDDDPILAKFRSSSRKSPEVLTSDSTTVKCSSVEISEVKGRVADLRRKLKP